MNGLDGVWFEENLELQAINLMAVIRLGRSGLFQSPQMARPPLTSHHGRLKSNNTNIQLDYQEDLRSKPNKIKTCISVNY